MTCWRAKCPVPKLCGETNFTLLLSQTSPLFSSFCLSADRCVLVCVFRSVMEKSFLEYYDFYEGVCKERLHLQGQNMQVNIFLIIYYPFTSAIFIFHLHDARIYQYIHHRDGTTSHISPKMQMVYSNMLRKTEKNPQ